MEERSTLLGYTPVEAEARAPTGNRSVARMAVLVASAVAVGTVAFYTASSATSAVLAAQGVGAFVQVTHYNKYSQSGKHPGKGYKHFTHGMMVEPHKPHTFSAELMNAAEDATGATWTVRQLSNIQAEGAQLETHSGPQAMVTFQHVGKYHVEVEVATSSGAKYVKALEMDSLYVRRDLRTLDSDDRATLFDTMFAMYTMSDSAGRERFGQAFRGMGHFTNVHLTYAGNRQGDRMHDGMGFITQHLALTSEFETALQAVDASLTVPYWDYTYEKYLVDNKTIENVYSSPMWDDDVFGSTADGSNTITAGRWAFLTVPRNHSAGTTNAYGYLRAPWNVNKSPFITRADAVCGVKDWDSWPGCITHYDVTFSGYYNSWYNYVWAASYLPHGPVHTLIGGYIGCEAPLDDLAAKIGVDNTTMKDIKTGVITFLKGLWRAELIEAPTCSDDTPQDACVMQCKADPYKNSDFRSTAITFMAQELGKAWISQLSTAEQQVFVDTVLCKIPYVSGDQLEAGSPSDPSFWSIHPTVDRLLQYRHLVNEFFDESWANPDGETSYCRTGGSCLGHHAEDLTPFETNFFTDDGTVTSMTLSNQELYEKSHPDGYALTYVYDTFEWEHCDAQDLQFVLVPDGP